jgi:hypothetical protein
MSQSETLGSYFRENKDLLQDYLETRADIFRLSAIRMISRSAGLLVWIIISLFLLFLIVLFGGLVLGLWLSELTHSHIMGFGLTTLLMVLIFSILALFRKSWFVDPVVRIIIRRSSEDSTLDDHPIDHPYNEKP